MDISNISINIQSSIKIQGIKTIYFDPIKLSDNLKDADYIFITHDHYDHFDISSIMLILNEKTIIILPKSMEDKIEKLDIDKNRLFFVEPNMKYNLENITFWTIPSYNINKDYHPKDKNYVGYILNMDDTTYYIAGDTDLTEESREVKADIAFVPIGGTYTMDKVEAATLINIIKPKLVIPTHYGSIVGNKTDGEDFKGLISDDIQCKILI